jgi:EmrB/QacA subfamily drug resistance transporter
MTETSERAAVRPGVVLLTAAGATFLAFLDTTVVNIAFPALQRDFPDSSLADLSWVLTGYAVLFAALLTPAGRLADVTGRRRMFGISVALFVLTSLLVALAPNAALLIAARILQGGAAAGMIPAALGLVLANTPPDKRAAAVGLWAAAGSLAAATGPGLGGLLIDAFGWRAVFLINVPLGLALLWLTAGRLPADEPSGRRRPDPIGTVMVTAGIAAGVLGLTQGGTWGWTDARTLACAAAAFALVPLALWRSARHPAPAVETDLWRNRVFASASVAALTFGMAMYAFLLLVPIYLTEVWDYSILRAGLAVSPGALTAAIAAVLAGRAPARTRGATLIGAALLYAAVAFWMYATLGAEPRYAAIFLPANLISGAAVGAIMTVLSAASAASLPAQRFAGGTGMLNTARQVGGALGIAAMAAILTVRASAGPDALLEVMLFCGLAALVTAGVGPFLRDRTPAA